MFLRIISIRLDHSMTEPSKPADVYLVDEDSRELTKMRTE